ncbi:hypothetical protein INR49_003960 [Caranx melampygus]|nr:hypothetical protein INR49_003960 [Caranx melampygus]
MEELSGALMSCSCGSPRPSVVTVQRPLLEVANQLRDALLESHVQADLGPVALTVTQVQDEVGKRRGFERSQGRVQSAHGFQDFKRVFAVSVVSGVQLSQPLGFPWVEGQVPGVDPGSGELELGVAPSSGKIFQIDPSDHPVQRVCEQSLFSRDETPQRGFELQRHQQTRVVQQRTSQAHFSQRHVGVTAVHEALDLSADVQSERLSPLHLMRSQCCPRVVVLLQTLLQSSTQYPMTEHEKSSRSKSVTAQVELYNPTHKLTDVHRSERHKTGVAKETPSSVNVGEAETKLSSSQLSAIFCSTFSSSAARPARSIN